MSEFNIRSESVDVEQIMKQIRARILEKRGQDYTEDQIRELASVRLEKFLEPKNLRSDLLEQFRKSRPAIPDTRTPSTPCGRAARHRAAARGAAAPDVAKSKKSGFSLTQQLLQQSLRSFFEQVQHLLEALRPTVVRIRHLAQRCVRPELHHQTNA